MTLYIVVAFLVLTLVVGVYFSRKKTTFREHAVGNKNFTTATLVATAVATAYTGGGLVRNIEVIRELGLSWVAIAVLGDLGLWLVGWLALRMGPFINNLSMAETMGRVYGKLPRIIVALFSIGSSITMVAMQVHVMSLSLRMCISTIDPKWFTFYSTLILIFYSTFGGIRAITFTDVLQFVTFAIILPFLAWLIFSKLGKPFTEVVSTLQNQNKFQLGNIFHFDRHLLAMVFFILSIAVSYIDAPILHRVYMSSGPTQARKAFRYCSFFGVFINIVTCSIGLFVFIGEPALSATDIWPYIISNIPWFFRGFLCISLLAMSMSTADSCLNTGAIAVSHDMLETIRGPKALSDSCKLWLARGVSVCIGLFSMVLAFYYENLLELLELNLSLYVPVTVAPFILAIFGFRGTSRSALIGMGTGVLTILAWDKWVTGINGSFVAMLANGLAILAAHYLFKQPEGTGWVGPDTDFKQMQQAKARKSAERKEAIKNGWVNRKATLAKLKPSHTTMVFIGFYLAITSLVTHFIAAVSTNGSWLVVQLLVAAFFIGYPFIYDICKTIRGIPTGLGWLIGLVIYFPLNLLWNFSHSVDPIFTISLSLAHFALILWSLPLDLAIGVMVVTVLIAIYPISISFSYPLLCSLFPLLLVTLLLFFIIISLKVRQGGYIAQLIYLKNKEQISSSQQLKSSLYDAALIPSKQAYTVKGHGFILKQVVRKVEESISFLDKDTPFFKEDFQSIINKLYDWVTYFNRKEKAKEHALLQPTKITLDKLIRKVEVALSQEIGTSPRLLLETVDSSAPHIVCDIHQVVYLLVKAVLRVGRIEGSNIPIIRIQLHPTTLRFKQADAIDKGYPAFMEFSATALIVSQSTMPTQLLPKVKPCYDEVHTMGAKVLSHAPPSIDLEQDAITSIVHAHYGYVEIPTHQKQPAMLFVFPSDVTDIRDKMIVKLPIDCLTADAPVTPQEQADSMMVLMKFHDHVCKYLCKEDPVDIKIISGLLLLLRQHFGFKRHASGQLFYVRSVGIAQIVVDWVFHSPKVIYASLLYELVRYTCLPLSYIKEHYNLGVYAFVSNVLKIDKREALDHPSLLCIENRLEKALKEDHVQLSVLFIKLAERLYDLRHAPGYIQLTEVDHMAQETLTIDVPIANQYLGQEIGATLEVAAQEALNICQTAIIEKA